MNKPKIIVVSGPTATGKSDLAVLIALHLAETEGIESEIISADSRQVYRGLDLGTGKITKEEMQGIPHHLLDICDPLEVYSVSSYKDDSKKCIEEILKRGNIPIIAGGTGLYIDAAVGKLSLPGVPPNQELRDQLEPLAIETLTQKFEEMNHGQPHNVDMSNKRRIIRAIEILSTLGSIPEIKQDDSYDVLYISLDMPDEVLKNKIMNRIELRLNAGMIQESVDLLAGGKLTLPRMRTLGLEYAHIAELLEKTNSPTESEMKEFKEKLFFGIWHYVKRQRTWFKRNKEIKWYFADENKKYPTEEIFNQVSLFLKD